MSATCTSPRRDQVEVLLVAEQARELDAVGHPGLADRRGHGEGGRIVWRIDVRHVRMGAEETHDLLAEVRGDLARGKLLLRRHAATAFR
jgi:hypothetical protein